MRLPDGHHTVTGWEEDQTGGGVSVVDAVFAGFLLMPAV